ncbi:hypothetical protein NFI96_017448 [Prochilodus magdalenae]|nr:hypothetical protein NFI96_017448 [Prochilodus magdalenae]
MRLFAPSCFGSCSAKGTCHGTGTHIWFLLTLGPPSVKKEKANEDTPCDPLRTSGPCEDLIFALRLHRRGAFAETAVAPPASSIEGSLVSPPFCNRTSLHIHMDPMGSCAWGGSLGSCEVCVWLCVIGRGHASWESYPGPSSCEAMALPIANTVRPSQDPSWESDPVTACCEATALPTAPPSPDALAGNLHQALLAVRTLPTGCCPQDAAVIMLSTGCCPQNAALRTLPPGRCPQDAVHRTLPTGRCHHDAVYRMLPTECCPQDAAHRMLSIGCCPQDAVHRTLPPGCCPKDAALRMLSTGCCPQDAFHRTLPTGCCPQDAVHRMLPPGCCPQDAAPRMLPSGCCPQDAAPRILSTGHCPQDAAPRMLFTWFERVSMLVILLNCVTLGMFQPCQDLECHSERCSILQAFDDFIFAFFAVEMVVKMVALGVFGPKCYLGDTWNRLDLFIVMAGMLEYSLDGHNVSFSAIRTVRVLRPLRAINRVPSMRILVTLLLDTLPMLGNVLLLCFFVFFIFGIVGVQLWAGLLRNRCFLDDDVRMMYNLTQSWSPYYRPEDSDDIPFICSTNRENGMLRCSDVPPRRVGGVYCQLSADNITDHTPRETTQNGCVNWNAYYNNCRASEHNPHNGAINFDNIGYAWIAIFQVITLEGWVDIMYYVMDAHSFYNFIYFIFLIIVGSFFMINLCLVVIATQFSETKQRENQLMREQRARFRSNESTLASLTEPGSCYEEMIKYLRHLCRKLGRQLGRVYGSVRPCRRGRSSSPRNSTAGGGSSRHWNSSEKFDLTRHLIHHHRHHRHHCNGMDAGTLEMKALQLGGEGQSLKQTPPLPLALPGVKGLNYPTILPSALFTHSRTNPGCASGAKTPAASHSLHGRTARTGVHETYGKVQHGMYPDVCSSACMEGGDGLAPGELAVCPICAPEGSGVTYDSDSDSETEKRSSRGAEAKKFSRDAEQREKPAGNCLGVCLHCVRGVLRRIVDSKYFNRGIMFAILINTLSMGVEYHEQPAELTDVLEISNIVFTSLFALEMLLKLLACGLFGYISNPYNIFDLIIVIIRHGSVLVWEIIGQADGGLSVLRTFRLLRVLKLVRFMPALRRQLVVLMKTMDNVATFCMLLMLFIFIFSILGMHLFGCKFTLRLENGDTVSDRKNFDSLLWAIVTVFQILTQEDWNVVLYNGMASTSPWAALYFVALMTFGNYVLFNLLVAILVEGFQAEGDASRSESEDDVLSSDFDEEDKLRELLSSGKDVWSEVKMQTLMPISNGHLEPRAAMPPHTTHMHPSATPRTEISHIDMQSRRSSNASNEHHDQRSLSSLWGSRRSSWNSLGHAPSLKRRGQSGERESLLSGEGRDSLDDDQSEGGKSSRTGSLGGVSRLGSFDMPELLQVPSMSRPYMECNGRLDGSYPSSPYMRQPSQTHAEEDEDVEEVRASLALFHSSLSLSEGSFCTSCLSGYQCILFNGIHLVQTSPPPQSWCLMLKRILEPYKPQWCRDHEDWSLYLFSPQNEFRVRCQKVITHKMFDHIVLIFIFLNCITIALERPDIQPYSMERVFLSVSNYIFTVIFVAEMTVKVVAMGMYVGPGLVSAEQAGMFLDGLLVFVSIVDILVSLASSGGNRILGILRVLRLLRTLRPLRVISRAPGLKLVVETLITSLRPIGNIVLICCAFFIVFGILGVQV